MTNNDYSRSLRKKFTKIFREITGNGMDYMNLALQDGGVALTVKLGIGKLDTQINTDAVRFDDNQWHHVLVSRESSKVIS